jgi:hypothetical protein
VIYVHGELLKLVIDEVVSTPDCEVEDDRSSCIS